MADDDLRSAEAQAAEAEAGLVAASRAWAKAHGEALRTWVLAQARSFVVHQPSVSAQLGEEGVPRLRAAVEALGDEARRSSEQLRIGTGGGPDQMLQEAAGLEDRARTIANSVQTSLEHLLRPAGYTEDAENGWRWYTAAGHRHPGSAPEIVLGAAERGAREQVAVARAELRRARDRLERARYEQDMAAAARLWGSD